MLDPVYDEVKALRAENAALRKRLEEIEGLIDNSVKHIESQWRLSRTQAQIVEILIRADEKPVRTRTICREVYRDRKTKPARAEKWLGRVMLNIRRKVGPFGVVIENKRDWSGYSLRQPKPTHD